MNLFCFGQGYTATRLISSLSKEKWQYSGTRRDHGEICFNGTGPIEYIERHLKEVTHILISTPPMADIGDPVFHFHGTDIEKLPSLKWVGYLSATSIYGDHNGDWVDEKTPETPSGERGEQRLNAEKQWRSLDIPLHIFRLAGIYGPDRNQIKSVKTGTARKIIKENHVFSRIHVDDIVSALVTSMDTPIPGIYNLSDDTPASTADVLDYICDHLDLPLIEGKNIAGTDISPALRSFYADNKRVKNDHVKKAFNWAPKYPSYKEGYSALFDELDKRSL
ncbi:SDR family oxidoreductase [Pseudemcibacter aquimaris]|uniref:SDR family oxidoreductase n=1 Tax=Pseudemcibacter aquimaris TaxID=2857064 RepID=UPI002011625C|nr:SDR family oxidoreductase [Pseudemcibacter aquimaris]MCC3861474.1 SDR family oxidoreductase [Pseudemcibacter aquimaris]WDU58243.1 SDR family oxidoreductase [Pseudemcibacter aquimaris]